MAMLEKITKLKEESNSAEVKQLCESAIAAFSTTIYNNVPQDARFEIERIALTELFEGLSAIDDESAQTWVKDAKRIYNTQHIGVRSAINELKDEGKENPALGQVLETYKERLDDTHEALLYESFTNALNTFTYFPKVQKAIDSIFEKVKGSESDILITKIIESMKQTKSNYLIPLIEDVVNDYLNNKNDQTKSFLKESLMKFSYDDHIKAIINILAADAQSLQLEYANAECEMEKIHSPLIYLGENEVVFNVKGTYYIKKGNIINRFPTQDIDKLDESFVQLCNILNLPNVEIGSKDIHVFGDKDYAQISENKVLINEQEFNDGDFAMIAEEAKWSGNQEFYYIVESIKKNFEEIAEVDFAKRVFLRENDQHSADIFKLRDNVFISTHNPELAKTTFYRNVNPIQAKNIMMEHLNFDVSKTFASLLPHEEKIKAEINETKEAFTDYITLLEGKIQAMSAQTANNTTVQVLDVLKEELNSVKNEYKDYLNLVETYMRAPEDVEISSLSEEITVSIDVNGKKYVVPIPDGNDAASGDEEESDAGTVVGSEDIENEPASSVTFDDGESELLGDSPSIQDDQIDLDADEVEQDAEDAEAEAEEAEEEAEAEDNDFMDGDDADLDLEDEGEEDEEMEDEEEAKKKKKKKKKKEKNESLEKSNFINDSHEGDHKPKKKVFLLKKKKK